MIDQGWAGCRCRQIGGRTLGAACMVDQNVERLSRCGCRRSLFRNRVSGIRCLFDKPSYSDMSACVCLCAVGGRPGAGRGPRDRARGLTQRASLGMAAMLRRTDQGIASHRTECVQIARGLDSPRW